jgi:hypothetical protein
VSPSRRGSDDNSDHGNGTLSLRTWLIEAEAAGSIARQVVGTAFVPESLKRWMLDDRGRETDRLDLDATVATVASALLAGQELGFGPMASLRSIDIIHGTPALRAIACRALVQTHGHDIWVVESTGTRAIVRGQRKDSEVQQVMWDLPRARLLGLYPGRDNGQWRRQPQSQLVARATAEMARWIDSDGLLGLPYIAEELIDAEYELAQAIEAAGDGEGKRKRSVSRRRQPPARPPLPPGLIVPEQPGPPDAQPGAAAPPPPPPPPPPKPKGRAITKTQLAALNAKLREAGITSRADANALAADWVGRAIPNANDLTYDEANTVFGKLNEMIAAIAAQNAAEEGQGEAPEPPNGDPPGGEGE